ncbi:MAG TPA: sigma factor-like helix-turn-helix DNA-binding protein [Pedococcus sp.]|nr:sigma factor-like helix-turn-helix DNA-binding protein [Pedococcus sp.]
MRREVDAEFAEYVGAREHDLLRAAFLVCGDPGLAQGLLQRSLTRLALRWDKVRLEDPDTYVRQYLYRDAVAASSRLHRNHRDHPDQLDDPGGTWAEVAGAAASDSELARRGDLGRALADLSAKQRAVLVLRYFEGRTEGDTADLLGVSVGAVRNHTHSALARLPVDPRP